MLPFRVHRLLVYRGVIVTISTRVPSAVSYLELSYEAFVLADLNGASCLGVAVAPLVELVTALRRCGDVHTRAFAVGAATGYGTLCGVGLDQAAAAVLIAAASATALASAATLASASRRSVAATVVASVTLRVVEVNHGLTSLDSLEHCCLN